MPGKRTSLRLGSRRLTLCPQQPRIALRLVAALNTLLLASPLARAADDVSYLPRTSNWLAWVLAGAILAACIAAVVIMPRRTQRGT